MNPDEYDLLRQIDELLRDKARALHQLQVMRGNGVIDLNKLEQAIKGEQP